VTNTVDSAPTWIRRYDISATISAIFCADLVPIIAVLSGLSSPMNDVVVNANAFGRTPPSSASTTSSGLVSASAIRGLGQRDEPASVFAGRFARGSVGDADSHADSGSPRRRPRPSSSARQQVITGAEQSPISRDVGAPLQLQPYDLLSRSGLSVGRDSARS
jgi:hypothetical protein